MRFHRGVYRLRDYPSFEREEVVAAWLAVGKESSVVSHESALELLDLSDVIPNSTHLTVLRARRRRFPKLPGVTIHTTVRPLRPVDLTTRDGIRLTSAARSILDAAEAGTDPGQIERATHQAIDRGLTTVDQLVEDARARSQRLLGLIEIAVRRPSR